MRKVLISLAAAGTALVFATPAAAQYYQQPYGYNGYGYNNYNGYNGYGYNNWGQMRSLQARVDNVERQIRRLDRGNAIGDYSADHLRAEANAIERRLHMAARNGLSPWEARDIQQRISLVEQRVQYAVANNYGRYRNYGGYGNYGYNRGYYVDRDRDGRDDRYEDDHGWDRDD